MTEAAEPYLQPSTTGRPRVVVALTTLGGRLVRTRRFRRPQYIGDPINAVRIFSDKCVDEIILLETGCRPFDCAVESWIARVAAESLVPIGYGGGLRSIEHCRRVIKCGFEKVVLNTVLHDDPSVARSASSEFGSQAVVASIEVGATWFGHRRVLTSCGRRVTRVSPVGWAEKCASVGCGELLVTSVTADGSMSGYDLELVSSVAAAVSVPVIALGGAGSVRHMSAAVSAGASAVAAGSMFVYHGPLRGVLLTYPSIAYLEDVFSAPNQRA